jgi:small subunit ribosomal protein S17
MSVNEHVKTRLNGTVVSDKMEKTVVVAVERQVSHGLYLKGQRKTSRFMAHDETNEVGVGDRVEIVESRPLSHRKRWAVLRVTEKAQRILP